MIWTGLVLSTLVHVRQATQLFPWRLGPHCVLVLQALACAGAASVLLRPSASRKLSVGDVGLVIAGVALLCMFGGNRNQTSMPALVLSICLGVLVWKAVSAAVAGLSSDRVRQWLFAWWSKSGGGVVAACTLVPLVSSAVGPMSTIEKRMNGGDGRRPR